MERLVSPLLFVVGHRDLVTLGGGYHCHQLFTLSGEFVLDGCLPSLVVEIRVGSPVALRSD